MVARKKKLQLRKRQRYVSDHAILQVRARLSQHDASIVSMSDRALASRLDAAVQGAVTSENYEEFIDRGDVTKLVNLCFAPGLYALVKRNYEGDGKSGHAEAIITVLDEQMVERARKSGRWVK